MLSLFDGIGGLRGAWELLRLPVAVFVASEIDKTAKRSTKAPYPLVVDLGAAESIDDVSSPALEQSLKG